MYGWTLKNISKTISFHKVKCLSWSTVYRHRALKPGLGGAWHWMAIPCWYEFRFYRHSTTNPTFRVISGPDGINQAVQYVEVPHFPQ